MAPTNRDFAVGSPLGEGVLLLAGMTATESLGRPFEFELDLRSEDHAIAMDDILGQNMTIAVAMQEEKKRYFNGYVARFRQGLGTERWAHYSAVLRPWLWFLTRTSDCRIFQEASAVDIVKEVFRDHGFTDFEEALNGTYPEYEYCVQYRETDFDFVSRLMEREGIYYFFRHEDGKHKLVLADSPGSHKVIKGYEEVRFLPPGSTVHRRPEHVNRWSVGREVQPGAFALNDFDFERPKAKLLTRSTTSRKHAAADFEMYDYPGRYTKTSDGDNYAKYRLEELQAQFERVDAGGDARGFAPGGIFSLTDHPRDDQNRKYLIVSATHHCQTPEFHEGPAGGPVYTNTFTAIDAETPYRAPRVTPRPVVQGPQTAIVVGKKDEEIWTDKHGRVRVQFHWDRYGKADEKSSCWVRVSQPWAGKNWGAIQLPRIGQEVVIDFLEGDPDRPIITGRVYNGQAQPPYELPANATITSFKSNSSKRGSGFNELRFEDKKGEEQIFVHGEKNFDLRVKNDRFETIGHDRHLVIENDKKEHVKNDRHELVDNHHHEKIGGDRNLKVVGKQAAAIEKSLSLQVTDDVIEVFKKNHSEKVTKDYYLKADNIVIEAATNVTIKVGQSFVAMEKGGIKIGTTGDIVLDATGNLEGKALADLSLEGTGNASVMGTGGLKLESAAIAELKGSLVKIN